jgi:hypothetical protein
MPCKLLQFKNRKIAVLRHLSNRAGTLVALSSALMAPAGRAEQGATYLAAHAERRAGARPRPRGAVFFVDGGAESTLLPVRG